MLDDSLRVDTNNMLKIREILNFSLRGTGKEITSIVPHQITIKEDRKESTYHSYNYNSYGMPYIIYKMIPDLLDMEVISVKIQDYSSILDIYISEVNKRLSTEESAEIAPENLEYHEETIGT